MSALVACPATLGRFCRLRQAAYHVKLSTGLRQSADPIVADHHFTNVVRTQDPGTVLAAELLARHRLDDRPGVDVLHAMRVNALWTTLAYRLTNRREVWEAYRAENGFWPLMFLEEDWLAFLEKRAAAGRRVFTGRHYTTGMNAYTRTLHDLRSLEPAFVAEMFRDAPTFTDEVRTLRGVGPFFGWQATADLLMSGHLPPAPGHVLLGPGAVLSLRWMRDFRPFREMFNAAGRRTVGAAVTHMTPREARDTATDLWATQRAWLHEHQMVGVEDVPWDGTTLSLVDLEHALCEYGRWGVYHARREIRAEQTTCPGGC